LEQNRWVLTWGWGAKRHRQWSHRLRRFMASSCAKPSIFNRGLSRKNKNHNQSRRVRTDTFEQCDKRGRTTTGRIANWYLWFRFSPVILARFLGGDDNRTPEVMALAIDGQKDFIQVPLVT